MENVRQFDLYANFSLILFLTHILSTFILKSLSHANNPLTVFNDENFIRGKFSFRMQIFICFSEDLILSFLKTSRADDSIHCSTKFSFHLSKFLMDEC